MLRPTKDIFHCRIAARDGQIGSIENLYFDHTLRNVRYLVVDTGHWLSHREVLLLAEGAEKVDFDNDTISYDLTRDQVKSSPELESPNRVGRGDEQQLAEHYGWVPYWDPMGATMGQGVNLPGDFHGRARQVNAEGQAVQPGTDRRQTEQARQHEAAKLFNLEDLVGCKVIAGDSEAGEIADFLVDPDDWSIQMLVVAMGHWPNRSHRLVPIEVAKFFDAGEKQLILAVEPGKIDSSPGSEYQPVDAEQTRQIYAHFGLQPDRREAT
ncbi:MAG: PRC-barrel domain-containing protein [Phycisphaerae bacterium]